MDSAVAVQTGRGVVVVHLEVVLDGGERLPLQVPLVLWALREWRKAQHLR